MAEEQVNEHRYKQDPDYFENLDKRSKEYKGYKAWKEAFDNDTSIGVGDIVEKVTEATGIKKATKKVFDKLGKDCGCDKRKEKLNKLKFKFKPVRCFTEDQYNAWGEFYKRNPPEVTYQEQTQLIIPIYAQLFARQLKPMSCCIEPYIQDINRVYEQYQ